MNKILYLFYLSLLMALVSGCSSTSRSVSSDVSEVDPVLQRIEALAQNIAKSSQRLSDIEQSRFQSPDSNVDFSRVPNLTRYISLGSDFNGPLESFLIQLSVVAQFNEPRILGLRPSNGMIISVDARYRRVVDILMDVGVQTGDAAIIVYKGAENLLEVTYPK